MSIEPPDKQSDKLRRSEMLCASTPNISSLCDLRFLGDGFYKHAAPLELGTESRRLIRNPAVQTAKYTKDADEPTAL